MALENILPKTINKTKTCLYAAITSAVLLVPSYSYSSTPAPMPQGAHSSPAPADIDYSKQNREYHEKQKQDKWYPGYFLLKAITAGAKSSIDSITNIKMELHPFGKPNTQQNTTKPKEQVKPAPCPNNK